MASTGKIYLITGGLGFIGSNFIQMIYDKEPDARIINIDSMEIGSSINNTLSFCNNPGYKHVKASINEINQCRLPKPDWVINFAAESHVDRSIDGSLGFTNANILGAHVMMEYAKDHNTRFLQISTDEVYGDILDGKFTEDSLLKPSNPYAASKAAADLLALSYVRTYGSRVMITRSCNNYGPNQYPEKLIPLFMKKLMAGDKVPIYGNGKNVREWIHVKDNCEAIWTVMQKGEWGNVYNIGSGEELTNLDVTATLLREFGFGEEKIDFVPDRPGHDLRYSVDSSKIRALGWEPKYDFATGISETIKFYKNRGFDSW